MATKTVHRQCNLCEAHCGITVEVDGAKVLRITGDTTTRRSRGYICPKAAALTDLYEDPDRLSKPIRRVGDDWVEMEWDEALDFAADGLKAVMRAPRHRQPVVLHWQSERSHVVAAVGDSASRGAGHAATTRRRPRPISCRSTGRRPRCSATSASSPFPTSTRPDYLLVLGANPSVSNGSLMSAPGARAPPARHRQARRHGRGGRPAPHRDRQDRVRARRDPAGRRRLPPAGHAARPLRRGPDAVAEICTGVEEITILAAAWTPRARPAPLAGVDAETIARLARDFAAAPTAAAYGRVGVCQQRTGTLIHWLINVLNAVTGNLDREGGACSRSPSST